MFEKGGCSDFRLKTGKACFQALGAVLEPGRGGGGGGVRQEMPVQNLEALSYDLNVSLHL